MSRFGIAIGIGFAFFSLFYLASGLLISFGLLHLNKTACAIDNFIICYFFLALGIGWIKEHKGNGGER